VPCGAPPGRHAPLDAAALGTALTLAGLSLLGCATVAAPGPGTPSAPIAASAAAPQTIVTVLPPAPAASGTPGSAPAARPDPAPPRPFAEVSKDAKRQDGFVPVWRKDEKVWLEVAPERIGKPMLFSINIAQSVGERGLYGSQMGPRWMVEFRRIGNQMQLVARQVGYRGERDLAAGRAVGEGFSESLIASSPVASADHPERKSVLVDAGFLLADLIGYSTRLEQAFRLPFASDRANSFFEAVHTEPGLTALSAKVHYAVPRIPAPPLLAPGAPAPQTPTPPQTTPDARSLFVGFVYNLRELPADPMAVRAADPRVGFFTDSYTDLSDDLRANPRVHNLKRWRLQKKDPSSALSEPVMPITYWLDRNIPVRYRASVEAGVLEWNKAFERIGFRNALVVRQQGEGDTFNTMDAQHASIRWFVGADVGLATGPSHSDPRTGEILDADIGMSDVFGRGARRQVREEVALTGWGAGTDALGTAGSVERCSLLADGPSELAFALDVMEARGELEPDSAEAEAFVQNYVKSVITHEVGHTLGLRHNFRASTAMSRTQLKDKAFGQTQGISASVMDYNPLNLALEGEPRGEPNMLTLGAYDYWAIEYGYKPIEPGQEAAELKAIAERSRSDKALAFGDDGDAVAENGDLGIDPLVNTFDQGDDPLAYAQRRLQLSKQLWARVQRRPPQAGDDPERARRSVLSGFRQVSRLPAFAAKYVGGMHTSRDLPGGGTPNYRPVEPAQQRAALRFLTEELFSNDSFRFKPEFLAVVSADSIEFARPGPLSVPQAVLGLQVSALDGLLSAGTARRLLELPNYLPEDARAGAISLDEVYATVQGAVWSELKTGKPIDAQRRALQREYLKRLQALLTRPAPALPADALSLTRMHARELLDQLRRAMAKGAVMPVETRAHLEDALALVTEALRATLQRG
jgi:hypothetical protein